MRYASFIGITLSLVVVSAVPCAERPGPAEFRPAVAFAQGDDSAVPGDDQLRTKTLAPGPVHVLRGAFVDSKGRRFQPRGFNYIRLFPGRGHNTFDPEHYDYDAIEQAMRRWQQDGFNVVRVFLNSFAGQPGSMALRGQAGLSAEYLRNVADFLECAQSHGLRVMLCTESFPRVPPYSDGLPTPSPLVSRANAEYLEQQHIAAKGRYLRDLIRALQQARPGCLSAVFSYDLHNELCFHGSPPFTLEQATIVAASGKSYSLPEQRQQLADDAAVHLINTLADAVKAEHPGALVSASMFTYAAVGRPGPGDFSVKQALWQNRIPFRPLAVLRSRADFLDLHFYSHDAAAFARDLASVEFDRVRRLAKEMHKPLFVGEFGAFRQRFPEIEDAARWMKELVVHFDQRGFAGWLHWTYDTHEQNDQLWHACDGQSAIYNQLRSVGTR